VDAYKSLDATRVAVERGFPPSSRSRDECASCTLSVSLTNRRPWRRPGSRCAANRGLAGGLQTSFQASSGAEVSLPAEFVAAATVFDNVYLSLMDPLGIAGEFDLDNADTVVWVPPLVWSSRCAARSADGSAVS